MNLYELKYKLDELNVYKGFYLLEGEFLSDRIFFYHNYNRWEVFYFDERANRDNEKIFSSESDASEYIYEHFKKQINYQ